eukprot:CAMPEP_0185764684 /NCGR_PEP_ID=MMETSP1174-20130828/23653_1 /TAXON_ID=35687 /ORGANISM="Dictyocha speculum, Strain CCMP1381" /LENGTH=465 /DNA_ID=CAMNT_0028447337 /DNA_START=229 /DNA_END=1626 /DNA_ORIENTATION=+
MALRRSIVKTNNDLRKQKSISAELSGTTCIAVLIISATAYVANVGDSRAIASLRAGENEFRAVALSQDQTPYRQDERKRVLAAGARVMTDEQKMTGNLSANFFDGELNLGEELDDDGNPPRVWLPDKDIPGCAFTRSLGDFTVEKYGVMAEAEVEVTEINQSHACICAASDGIFEFLTNQDVTTILHSSDSPLAGCKRVVRESVDQWMVHEARTDDMTMVLVMLAHMDDAPNLCNGETKVEDPVEREILFEEVTPRKVQVKRSKEELSESPACIVDSTELFRRDSLSKSPPSEEKQDSLSESPPSEYKRGSLPELPPSEQKLDSLSESPPSEQKRNWLSLSFCQVELETNEKIRNDNLEVVEQVLVDLQESPACIEDSTKVFRRDPLSESPPIKQKHEYWRRDSMCESPSRLSEYKRDWLSRFSLKSKEKDTNEKIGNGDVKVRSQSVSVGIDDFKVRSRSASEG